MFVLMEMVKTVRIPPVKFQQELNSAIIEELDKELANKVIINKGLCMCVTNLTHIGDAVLIPRDGAAHIEVKFNIIVFRPKVNEIIQGRIRNSSPEGIHVTIEFFDDILIPPTCLPDPSAYNESERAWYWKYDKNGEIHDLYMDVDNKIKFRVQSEHFENIAPNADKKQESVVGVPYKIIGSMSEQGLGVLEWWT